MFTVYHFTQESWDGWMEQIKITNLNDCSNPINEATRDVALWVQIHDDIDG